jgi:chromosome segregation ATPase
VAYEWTVFATMAALLVAVVGLLATTLFQQGAKIDRLADRVERRFDQVAGRFDQVTGRFDQVERRFDQVERRFDSLEQRLREDKAELLGRLDVLAERITRLEAG